MSKNLKVQVNAVFKCDLERAFKIPILGDATKFLRGYFVLPAVVAFEDDETWGREGGSRYPIAAKNMFTKGGKTGFDQIYKREENKYWNWGVTEIEVFVFGITKFEGELFFAEKEDGIHVQWIYHGTCGSALMRPFAWVFFKWLWKKNIKKGISYMKEAAEGNGEILYS
jgi:hypothetical protein